MRIIGAALVVVLVLVVAVTVDKNVSGRQVFDGKLQLAVSGVRIGQLN